ncbi:MAG: hypothetical protein HRU07_03935 [Nitrosopumilus sp.]|nr:hypothetical protein [Nitrosopumilus sp.]NRA05305.1 hypothetical protein [Nitrosopumilus sp.]
MKSQNKIINPDGLTSKQLVKYDDSLEVLRLMRKGTSFSKASSIVGVSSSIAKRFLSSAIFKRKNRIRPKKNDNLIRKLRINEKGKEVFISVKGNKKSRVVAQYYGAIGQAIDQNNPTRLQSFRKRRIKDIHGKFHTFDTNLENIQTILLQKEEPEFFTIYRSSS